MRPDERYQTKGKLGEGGMGTVYRAFDSGLMRDVAIKVIRREAILDRDARMRFDQEAKSAGMLNHPGIVTIYDRGEVDGQPYIVMELVEGRTLEDLIKQGGPAPDQLIAIVKQVAAALDYAHGRQVVHRDIKPANIMVHADGTAKVMDFGIAKSEMSGGGVTAVGMMVGSPHYVPPERFMAGEVSGATDLWALAVTAYEAVAGRRPFQADNWDTLTYQICHQPPQDLVELKPGTPKAVAATLAKALSKKPQERFQTCASFAEALALAYRQQPPAAPLPKPDAPTVVAPMPSPVARPPRKTIPLALGGGVLGLLLAAVVWVATQGDSAPDAGKAKKADEPRKIELPKEPRTPPPAVLTTSTGEMVLVPAGEARLGEKADRVVTLAAFYIDKTEVPVDAYRRFCRETGRSMEPSLEAAGADLPVVNVSWEDAQSFSAWAGKRLPTADEWEKAARGASGQALPWGPVPKMPAANVPTDPHDRGHHKLAAVNSYSAGASPYGVLNMVGNVWEWTATISPIPPGQFDQYRQGFPDLKPPVSETDTFYQTRGGSYMFVMALHHWEDLVWDPSSVPARVRRPAIGFRCVQEIKQ